VAASSLALAALQVAVAVLVLASGQHPAQSLDGLEPLASIAAPVAAVTTSPTGGWWAAKADGSVIAGDDAPNYGSMGGRSLNASLVGVASTASGGGYWLLGSDGGIFTFGDAGFFGSTGAMRLNQPIVGMAATPSGAGYWLVAKDGGIFTFGDAGFFGSTGAMQLNQPIVGMAAAPSGAGYWLVAKDGGIFTFGEARFFGSTGAMQLNQPIVGITTAEDGGGYRMVAADGGIFSFGTLPFHGSLGDRQVSSVVVGMASRGGGGYVLVQADGTVTGFGPAVAAPVSPAPPAPTSPVQPPASPAIGSLSLSRTALRPGDSLRLSGLGFRPGSAVSIELHSDPIDLGTATTDSSGSVTTDVTIPPTAPTGSHTVVVEGEDPAGQPIVRTGGVFLGLTPPAAAWVSASPATVEPGDTVTISARVSDESGLRTIELQSRYGNSGTGSVWCPGWPTLVSGTTRDGVWSLTCTVPATAQSGTYTVTPYLGDNAGNYLNTNGGPTSTVKGTYDVVNGSSDFDAPVVELLTATPSTVSPGDVLTISAHLTDASGIRSVELQSMHERSMTGSVWCPGFAQLTSGTQFDGVWSLTCTVPTTAQSGHYTVTPYVGDNAGNYLNTNGGPRGITFGAYDVIDGSDDFDPPVVEWITAAPATVSPGEVLTISAHVTDASGVRSIELQSRYETSSTASVWCMDSPQLTSGTNTDGIWTVTCTVPEVANTGTYTVTPYVGDLAGNYLNTNGGPTSTLRATYRVL
jgi:hypothetical protein